MSTIHVRRSGLVAFAIKIGSTLTGLIFVVLVTRNLTPLDFGLWQLISRTIGYVLVPVSILSFWLTRYRARGMSVGRTAIAAALIFSVVLTTVYVLISFPISGSVAAVSFSVNNLSFFLISTPQIFLYVLAGALEAILWGISPEKASYGFASFEIAKVAVGFTTLALLHLGLEGAILSVIGAQLAQLCSLIIFTRKEYGAKASLDTIRKMVKTGWLAILNNIHPLVINLDFLVVGIISGSALPLALYGAAVTIATVVQYSNVLATGLYPSILSGGDASKSSSQILELQLIFTVPMALGAIVLAYQLLQLLNLSYTSATLILSILAIGSCFASFQGVQDSVIAGSDTIDTGNSVKISLYLKSKLFTLSKINLGVAFVYLIVVALVSDFFGVLANNTDISAYQFLGVLWAVSSTGMYIAGYLLKAVQVRRIVHVNVRLGLVRSIIISSFLFSIVLFLYSHFLFPAIGSAPYTTFVQAVMIVGAGIVSLSIYGASLYALDSTARGLVSAVIRALVRPSVQE